MVTPGPFHPAGARPDDARPLEEGERTEAEILAQVRRLEIHARRLASTSMAGDYRSIFRGSGIEFAEAREYTPGDDVRLIGQTPAPERGGPRLVLGPGTGLGLSALIEVDGRLAAIPSEGGHVDFGPLGACEEQLWPHLERAHGRITAEAVMSGPGLERLHAARLAMLGRAPQNLTAAQITKAGIQAEGLEREILRLLWNLVARFAGDMALAFVARGGVTLAGGVLPRIVSLLEDQTFRAAFEDKAPMAALSASIQTRLIVTDHAALSGMAAIGAAPERYAIDYSSRLWR